MNSSKSL